MAYDKVIRPIAYIHNDYRSKFGIPRQCGLTGALASIRFEPEYDDPACFKELAGYSHIWLIWGFSENEDAGWNPTVRPPRLGGNRRVGVFASRSPFRPNGLGLSVVRLVGIEEDPCGKTVLCVKGADLMDQTPIFDIKPYMPSSDSIPEAEGGFSAKARDRKLTVHFDPELLRMLPPEKRDSLIESLSLDPRPRYQEDPKRIYGMRFAEYDIHFQVDQNNLTIIDMIPCPQSHETLHKNHDIT